MKKQQTTPIQQQDELYRIICWLSVNSGQPTQVVVAYIQKYMVTSSLSTLDFAANLQTMVSYGRAIDWEAQRYFDELHAENEQLRRQLADVLMRNESRTYIEVPIVSVVQP